LSDGLQQYSIPNQRAFTTIQRAAKMVIASLLARVSVGLLHGKGFGYDEICGGAAIAAFVLTKDILKH